MSQREKLLNRKRRAMELMNDGVAWEAANKRARLEYSRRGIQQLYQRWEADGEAALEDNRHGHASKATQAVRTWLKARCAEVPEVRASQLVNEIKAEFEVELNPNYVTYLRQQLGLPVPRSGRPERAAPTEPTAEMEAQADFSPSGQGEGDASW